MMHNNINTVQVVYDTPDYVEDIVQFVTGYIELNSNSKMLLVTPSSLKKHSYKGIVSNIKGSFNKVIVGKLSDVASLEDYELVLLVNCLPQNPQLDGVTNMNYLQMYQNNELIVIYLDRTIEDYHVPTILIDRFYIGQE